MGQGAELMLLGMGAVFGFLTILVFVVKAVSALAQSLGGDEHDELSASVTARGAGTQNSDSNVVAAISAAVHRFRAERSA